MQGSGCWQQLQAVPSECMTKATAPMGAELEQTDPSLRQQSICIRCGCMNKSAYKYVLADEHFAALSLVEVVTC